MHMRQLRRTVFVAFVLWAAWTCATPVVAQDEKPKNVQLNIHLLAEPSTLTLVLDSDSFVAWLKPVAADIEKLLAKETDHFAFGSTLAPNAEEKLTFRVRVTGCEVTAPRYWGSYGKPSGSWKMGSGS